MSQKECVQWLEQDIEEKQLLFSMKAKERLLEMVDFDLPLLKKEMIKFYCLKKSVGSITVDIVEKLVPSMYAERFSDLIPALILGNSDLGWKILNELRKKDDYKSLVKYLLHFWESAYIIFSCLHRGILLPESISEETGIPVFRVSGIIRVLGGYSLKQIREMMDGVHNLELRLNRGEDGANLIESYFITFHDLPVCQGSI